MRIENPTIRVTSDKESKMMIEQKRKLEREREGEREQRMILIASASQVAEKSKDIASEQIGLEQSYGCRQGKLMITVSFLVIFQENKIRHYFCGMV